MQMMILLARLYPKDVELKGSLFLKVSKQGAILSELMVCLFHIWSVDSPETHT
jgi:hypothetical protein